WTGTTPAAPPRGATRTSWPSTPRPSPSSRASGGSWARRSRSWTRGAIGTCPASVGAGAEVEAGDPREEPAPVGAGHEVGPLHRPLHRLQHAEGVVVVRRAGRDPRLAPDDAVALHLLHAPAPVADEPLPAEEPHRRLTV